MVKTANALRCGPIAGVALGCVVAVVLSASASQAMERAETGDKLPGSIARLLKRHALDPSQVQVWNIPAFPKILVVTREIPDAGPFFEAALANGRWIKRVAQSGRDGGVWFTLGQAALRSRNWAGASTAARLSIARDWLVNGMPPGVSVRASDPDGHPITAVQRGADIVISAWIDDTHETIGGPRTYLATGPTRYRFHADGSISVCGAE